jgi:hypothetical protein
MLTKIKAKNKESPKEYAKLIKKKKMSENFDTSGTLDKSKFSNKYF